MTGRILKKVAPATEATGAEKNTSVLSAAEAGLSTQKTVPDDILFKQRQDVAARRPEMGKLLTDIMKAPTNEMLIEILKRSLASVTDALKSYANALHKDRHHPLPFVMCQKDECVYGRNVIDGAIAVIARAEEITSSQEAVPEDEEEGEPDPDQLAHDPDLKPPSEVIEP